jgi:transcriptional regulator with XRE-family HTH domain
MLSEFARQRREKLGLSLSKLAARTGMAKAHIHDIEKGRSHNPTCSTVVALAAGLQVSAVELFKVAAELSVELEQKDG